MNEFKHHEVKDGKVEISAEEFNELMLDSVKYTFALNGLKHKVPHSCILAVLEEDAELEEV